MHSAPSGPSGDDQCHDHELNLQACTLPVHKHERLAFTECPVKNSTPRPVGKKMSRLLEAMYHFVLSR